MNFEKAVININRSVTKKKPESFNDTWIRYRCNVSYEFIIENIKTELGDPDWDLVISKLDRWNQKLWMRGFKKRYIKLYKNKQEVNLILKRYNNKFYTFLVQVNKEDYVICDWISIRLVRVAQKRNILAKEKIISLLSWKGYNELIIQQIEGCVRRFRYTGSFLGYLYRTLQYSGLGLVPLEKFSFDDFLLK